MSLLYLVLELVNVVLCDHGLDVDLVLLSEILQPVQKVGVPMLLINGKVEEVEVLGVLVHGHLIQKQTVCGEHHVEGPILGVFEEFLEIGPERGLASLKAQHGHASLRYVVDYLLQRFGVLLWYLVHPEVAEVAPVVAVVAHFQGCI